MGWHDLTFDIIAGVMVGLFLIYILAQKIWLGIKTSHWVPITATVLERYSGGEIADTYTLQYTYGDISYRIKTDRNLVPYLSAEVGTEVRVMVDPADPTQCVSY